MKCVSNYSIQELTYKYQDETEKEMHKNMMINDGYTIVKNHPIVDNPLAVTYQKKTLNIKGARL